ncbi:hypothetical protein PFICI_09986 [Pestalotiopsis fici W106-1]|uniref:Uncharacterized protein n=1 Tax=Pestalotiopsis fici (strain W106-1 / CGMCC3.15140) TaxID=1229662 RepID=W3WVT0_PESFW|nr:uncharacterized protein PFICI_09986 [Pestalotiopsis fici W106-1]ETS77924.1 hypothetical protein PFICI_09986 [Pestalotiopsis fici W106-1]
MAAIRHTDIHGILAEVQTLLQKNQYVDNHGLQNLSDTLTAALELEPRVVHFSFAEHPEVFDLRWHSPGNLRGGRSV